MNAQGGVNLDFAMEMDQDEWSFSSRHCQRNNCLFFAKLHDLNVARGIN